MSNAEFRRHIAVHSTTVEQKLCAKEMTKIEYAKIPSPALNRYKNLFIKKDKERFLESVKNEKVNAAIPYPQGFKPHPRQKRPPQLRRA